jgi:hypothetical protein
MTDAEVFKALSGGAVVRRVGRFTVINSWTTIRNSSVYQICYNYTGISDVWEELKVEA